MDVHFTLYDQIVCILKNVINIFSKKGVLRGAQCCKGGGGTTTKKCAPSTQMLLYAPVTNIYNLFQLDAHIRHLLNQETAERGRVF